MSHTLVIDMGNESGMVVSIRMAKWSRRLGKYTDFGTFMELEECDCKV